MAYSSSTQSHLHEQKITSTQNVHRIFLIHE